MPQEGGAVAVITGAAHGIAAATAPRIADQGAAVMVTDVDDEAGRTLAAVGAGPDIRVDTVLPAASSPPLGRGSRSPRTRSVAAPAPRRLGRTEEMARAAAVLASADASCVTGASLVLDGGWSVMKESS
ncbi:SDR family oxidoreductase [Streptomyces sp. NPDC017435]|uniref:SDR family oxidoreductase n=1 Tax=Streptomyces sp. NPDC017435 TaxID=3364995 RepID=UPI0037AB6BF7